MAIKRKPLETSSDKIDDFISGATAEKTNSLTPLSTEESGVKGNSENNESKHLPQTSTSHVNMDELIGRGNVFATTFKRETYYVHKDLIKAINKMAAKGSKGEKTRIINRALQMYLEVHESKK